MNLLEVGIQTMRRNLSFEARAYQKKKEANSNSLSTSSSSSYNIFIEDCSYDEPDHIKNKISLYLFSCINCLYYNKLRKTILFKLPLAP